MAFSDYKMISQVQADYQLSYEEDNFVSPKPFQASSSFFEELAFNQKYIDTSASDAARCELVISPILKEVYKHYCETSSFWIQKAISFDGKLNGTPDYLISKKSSLGKTMLEFPLLVVAEAKKNDFNQGWVMFVGVSCSATFKCNGSLCLRSGYRWYSVAVWQT